MTFSRICVDTEAAFFFFTFNRSIMIIQTSVLIMFVGQLFFTN